MTHIQPAFDGIHLAAAAPATARRVMDDYEAWVDEVTPFYEAAADTRQPFTIDEIASRHHLPDPPKPKSMWGSLPRRLLDAGIIQHAGASTSARAGYSMVHRWIGVPAAHREAVARMRKEHKKAARSARMDGRRAA